MIAFTAVDPQQPVFLLDLATSRAAQGVSWIVGLNFHHWRYNPPADSLPAWPCYLACHPRRFVCQTFTNDNMTPAGNPPAASGHLACHPAQEVFWDRRFSPLDGTARACRLLLVSFYSLFTTCGEYSVSILQSEMAAERHLKMLRLKELLCRLTVDIADGCDVFGFHSSASTEVLKSFDFFL